MTGLWQTALATGRENLCVSGTNGLAGSGIQHAKRGFVEGAITSRDFFRHSLTILRLWGPSCYVRGLRAVVTRRHCTFLEIISARG
jgi:hypothetical protein